MRLVKSFGVAKQEPTAGSVHLGSCHVFSTQMWLMQLHHPSAEIGSSQQPPSQVEASPVPSEYQKVLACLSGFERTYGPVYNFPYSQIGKVGILKSKEDCIRHYKS